MVSCSVHGLGRCCYPGLDPFPPASALFLVEELEGAGGGMAQGGGG